MTLKSLIALQKRRINDKTIGEFQRKCRKRFLDDLLHGAKRGIIFNLQKAQRVVQFLEMMPHIKGVFAGERLKLEPWQKYDIIYPLFGFMVTVDGKEQRRYKMAYNEIARKNGKSMLASAIANYLAFGDNESGAEVYAVATKKDQAKIVWESAEAMKNRSALKNHVHTAYSKMKMPLLGSSFEPLGADSKTLDGLNVHGAIIDEYHAHPSSELFDVIRSATGSRKQPLIFIITTAGFNQNSACYFERKYAIDILNKTVQNDSYFVFIAALDEGDDPFDESVWIKANPNLKKSVDLADFRDMAKEAKDKPSAYNNFLTKKLNIWTNQTQRWINQQVWEDAALLKVEEKNLHLQECYAGLDLSSTTDISAFILLFPKENGTYELLCRFWIPHEQMRERELRDKVPYSTWLRAGYLEATPGNVIDYAFIEEAIKQDCQRFNIKEIAYDRWNATSLVLRLQEEGVSQMIPFGQGFASMSSPTKELETLILQRRLNHGNHPVLNWMCSNVTIKTDPAGNIKIDKSKSSQKVDGMVALVMALGIKMFSKPQEASPYMQRGLRTL